MMVGHTMTRLTSPPSSPLRRVVVACLSVMLLVPAGLALGTEGPVTSPDPEVPSETTAAHAETHVLVKMASPAQALRTLGTGSESVTSRLVRGPGPRRQGGDRVGGGDGDSPWCRSGGAGLDPHPPGHAAFCLPGPSLCQQQLALLAMASSCLQRRDRLAEHGRGRRDRGRASTPASTTAQTGSVGPSWPR